MEANVEITHSDQVGDFTKLGVWFWMWTQLVKDKWIFAATGRDIDFQPFNAWSSNLDKETEEAFIFNRK